MEKVEYELTTLHFSDNGHNDKDPKSAFTTIHMKAFDKEYVLYIEEEDSVLVGEKTPLILGYYDERISSVRYVRRPMVVVNNSFNEYSIN